MDEITYQHFVVADALELMKAAAGLEATTQKHAVMLGPIAPARITR